MTVDLFTYILEAGKSLFNAYSVFITYSVTRTRAPSSVELTEVGKRSILYSDIDYNMHMNNTRYPDMLCDYMPIDAVGRITGMTLSYLREASYGDTLTVLRGESDGSYYFKTVNSVGETCLEAIVTLS